MPQHHTVEWLIKTHQKARSGCVPDLSIVKFMSDRIMVMKSGELIEFEESDLLYSNPKKNYTKKLISSII